MGTLAFQRRTEDFICERCGATVSGSGYTNHCPRCLVSKHVDVFPGDRKAACGGLMEPAAYFIKHGEERLLHRCVVCGHEKENRVDEEDDRDVILRLVERRADRFAKETE